MNVSHQQILDALIKSFNSTSEKKEKVERYKPEENEVIEEASFEEISQK
jgi:lipoate-protein ligase A